MMLAPVQEPDRSGGLQAAVCRAKGSREENFGLETKATPAVRSN